MSGSRIECLEHQMDVLCDRLDKYAFISDSFAYDETYKELQRVKEEYRQAVMAEAPFTGWGL